jgi:O-antigen/teichoic acid export membrane protein
VSPWRGLVHSFSALAAGETVARVLGLLAVLVMARRLGPGAFGVVVLGTTLVNWFRLVVDSGTEVLGVRDTSREPERFRELTAPILGLRILLSLGAAALFAAAALIVTESSYDRKVLLLFALILPVIGFNLRWMILAVRGARAVAIGNIASQLLLAAGVVLLLRNRHDAHLVPMLLAGSELVYGLVVMAAVWRRFGGLRPRMDIKAWGAIMRSGLPLAGNNLARTAMYSFDILLIGVLLTRRDVGLYGAAYKPILFCSTLVGLFAVSFLSAYSAPASDLDRAQLVRRTVRTAAAVTVPAAIALGAGSALLVSLIYGPDYAGAAVPLVILVWTVPLIALSCPYSNLLIASDRQGVLMRHNVAGAITNMLGNAAAIPLAGITGAACVTVASFLLVLILNHRSAVALGLTDPFRATVLRAARPDAPPLATSPSGSGR